jgi:1-acyl-sn-glycerol-3-phosphate acyltransferase
VFPRSSRERRREIISWWSRKLLRVLAIELVVEGSAPTVNIPMIVAPNHVSWLDTFAISSVRSTRFIAKSEIRDWPIAGWVAQKAGTLFIRRAKRNDTARINELVHAALAEGDCVGFFPEGTTSEGDKLLKFHSSLFEPAVANGAPVQPIAIRYEHLDGTLCRAMSFVGDLSFQQSLGLVIRQKRTVARIRFATPVDPRGLNRREVARLAHERVASLLGLPGPDTAPTPRSGPPGAQP